MTQFADHLLRWWKRHGRHDLPWQHPRTAYRVWVSEIMLQQTRAETVADYFQRFMQRFPDLQALADAPLDDVLALWSGLGYYARARNLHAAAIRIRNEADGRMPNTSQALQALPGIGASTAAAIVAQAFDQRCVILDGNVKRVLARHAGVTGWPGTSAVEKRLWEEAEKRTPSKRAADYTQAIMDLGALVCRPRSPMCCSCPVTRDCVAMNQGLQSELPTPKPVRSIPERSGCFLIARDNDDRILLQRRPPSGIWGGLWCFPEAEAEQNTVIESLPSLAPLRHVFSHFALTMTFVHVRIEHSSGVADRQDWRWFQTQQALQAGLPRPVRTLVERLAAMDQSPPDASTR